MIVGPINPGQVRSTPFKHPLLFLRSGIFKSFLKKLLFFNFLFQVSFFLGIFPVLSAWIYAEYLEHKKKSLASKA